MAPETAPECPDEGRRLFYNRVGRHFLEFEPEVFSPPRPCAVCGEPLDRGYDVKGAAQCLPQRSIAERRPEAVPKKVREAKTNKDGSAAKPGFYGMFNNQRRAVLITDERSIVIVNKRPVGDLPKDMTWFTSGDDASFGVLYKALYLEPLSTPSLYVAFERRCDGPFILTRSPARVVQCGGGGTCVVDVPRLRAIVSMGLRLGEKDFQSLVSLRGKVLRGDATEKDQEDYLALVDQLPDPDAQMPFLPYAAEPAYETARVVLKSLANAA